MTESLETSTAQSVRRAAERVKAARAASGLSQEALAAASGVHRVTIARLEMGDLDPRFSTLHKVCVALGLSLGDMQ